MNTPKIYATVLDLLKTKLTKEQWVDFVETLGSDRYNDFLENCNELVATIAPEIYSSPDTIKTIVEETV